MTDFSSLRSELPFWRKIKFFGTLGKVHKIGMRGGSVGVLPVRSALTVMSSEEEADWEHFCSFSNVFGL